jgi:hypothetical protein
MVPWRYFFSAPVGDTRRVTIFVSVVAVATLLPCLVALWLARETLRHAGRGGRGFGLILLGVIGVLVGLAVAAWFLVRHDHEVAAGVIAGFLLLLDVGLFAVVPAVVHGIANP